ncbi:MAG TPA: YbaB/EbfC family nucleoid-associated protein [Acidimicrobiales bacterium]|nr:YbaB/EbfC family nucleoid-associated protein [Acidimicrobiales bacterium]
MADLPGDVDLGGLLSQMQQLQESVARAEAAATARHVTGTAAGGAVTVTASGELSFDAVTIDASVVDPADVAMLEDLVLAAVRDAAAKLLAMRREAMGDVVQSALEGLFGPGGVPVGGEPGLLELPE